MAMGLTAATLAVSPAATADSADFGFSVAFQGSNGDLWTVDRTGAPHDTSLGMAPQTNPSMMEACVAGACPIQIAFQANTGILWTLNMRTGVPSNTGLPMLAGTSPSLSYTSTGAVEVAYTGANGDLWTYVAGVGGTDTAKPIAGSPSISMMPNSGEPVIAYQTVFGGYMCLLYSDGSNPCPGGVMDPASSPSITYAATTVFPGDTVEVAYESIDDVLYLYNPTTGDLRRTQFNMAPATSPGIDASCCGIGANGVAVPQVAFQANTSALWLVTPTLEVNRSWTAGLAPGTSPSIREVLFDDGTGGPAIAFQGTDGRLWEVPATGSPMSTGLPMAPDTSPVMFPTF
jgi:hypothetical protein